MLKRNEAKKFGVNHALFAKWRSPREGVSNPTKVSSAVWEWLFHSKLCGYLATLEMDGPCPFDEGPTISFDRFGQTETNLLDGRVLYLAGEHEDYYDPDFYIYNDLIVKNTDGSLDFYIYPKSVFPATDFHSATLVEGELIMVGNLGYQQQRVVGQTQVLSLNIDSLSIKTIETSGLSPGWIHKHKAVYLEDLGLIEVTDGLVFQDHIPRLTPNTRRWILNTRTWHWDANP